MKKFISTLLALCLVLSSVSIVSAADVWTKASDWAVSDLNAANNAGLFPDSLKNVDLTQNITRAEQAALSVKIYEVLTDKKATAAENPFTDTNDGEVLKALSLGITSGTSATTFEPNANLTREQAASMLARVYKKINISGWTLEKDSEFNFEFTMPSKFADDTKISSWANQSVYFMASKKWILGKDNNNFAPLDSCTREQALIIAQRIVKELKNTTPAEKEKFTVACIGGSLTQGGTTWITLLKRYLQEKMPEKEVVTINSGIGGTTSEYGAMRFQPNVLAHNPDLVIIEFSVNDYYFAEDKAQIYMESMVRQCLYADKVPSVMFLHAPNPYCDEVNTSNDKFSGTVRSINAKNKLAKHYDIPVVDGMEYINNMYKETNKGESYFDWLAQYYNRSGDSYDVHPKGSGYKLFSDAIIAAFEEEGLESFLYPVMDAS
ncbi:MAG: S-layer homology domain-containing protein, partial [Clostridia bacterium]|nr:S-layer homology domain-containing protein [Clostridia bacterium]